MNHQDATQFQWIKPSITWGPMPTPRHSAVSWSDDVYFYVYGGIFEYPSDDEELHCYWRFHTETRYWEQMRTLGEFPPLEYRSTSFAAYDRSKKL
eukprot:TRINITY_DN1976_c0_g2_i1.p1 TRINITY_DN1976_c0_g2~~TRINITY_DN1976_c0_g2_i1.p1  ORF type:complete len:102 (-),score=10.37 TRINITY_DN1976_c0_g2_i1:51-335(-)